MVLHVDLCTMGDDKEKSLPYDIKKRGPFINTRSCTYMRKVALLDTHAIKRVKRGLCEREILCFFVSF